MSPVDGKRIVLARDFLRALKEAGVLPEDMAVQRVVIEADLEKALVMIHVQAVGDDRLLGVARTLEGVEVTHAPAGSTA